MDIDKDKIKRVIKGVSKTAGKYTLKGLGKGVELAGTGALKAVEALSKNEGFQTIAAGAGIISAGVMMPAVGVGLLGTLGLKYLVDNKFLKKDKGLAEEVMDIIKVGNIVTKNVGEKILSPLSQHMDKGVKSLGSKYQDKIDDMFSR